MVSYGFLMKDLIEFYDVRGPYLTDLTYVNYMNQLEFFKHMGPHFTLRYKNLVLGFIGIIKLHKGVGQVWLMLRDDIKKYSKILLKDLKFLLNKFGFEYHRLQCDVKTNHISWIKILNYLGFRAESQMYQFYPDKSNAYMMVVHNYGC